MVIARNANVNMVPIAFPFISIGINAVTIAGPMAVIITAPIAWMTRERINIGNELINPGRNPHVNEAMVKIENPIRNIFLYPIKSDNFPNINTQAAIIRTYAVMIELTELIERLNSFAMVGRAIVTMVASNPAMKFARAIEMIIRR